MNFQYKLKSDITDLNLFSTSDEATVTEVLNFQYKLKSDITDLNLFSTSDEVLNFPNKFKKLTGEKSLKRGKECNFGFSHLLVAVCFCFITFL